MVTVEDKAAKDAVAAAHGITGEPEALNNFQELQNDQLQTVHKLFARGLNFLQKVFPYIESALIQQATSPRAFYGRSRWP